MFPHCCNQIRHLGSGPHLPCKAVINGQIKHCFTIPYHYHPLKEGYYCSVTANLYCRDEILEGSKQESPKLDCFQW
uniref:Uncharacterized protein n=1 Tax=Physcomitrium patens TaxID=3218 RepID=A0A2K1L2A8_PHYPA|nr:hypothetical protein PHYPA_002963 [Physcomitrium patens]